MEKNRWSRSLTDEEKALGFLGWHERGYCRTAIFPVSFKFVTFRLADSMPASRRGEWEHLLKIEDDREKRRSWRSIWIGELVNVIYEMRELRS